MLEEFQPGWELSYFILTNGEDFVGLPFAQDHKRLLDKDQGLNTGGMGAYAPVPFADKALIDRIQAEILTPAIKAMKSSIIPSTIPKTRPLLQRRFPSSLQTKASNTLPTNFRTNIALINSCQSLRRT